MWYQQKFKRVRNPQYYFNTGRPQLDTSSIFNSAYRDIPNAPIYPFGYGISYTNFEYSDISLSAESFDLGEEITAAITVTNTGDYAGEEVVQLYIRDIAASSVRPMKELKGFEKIMLEPGESKEVRFSIDKEMLSFYNPDLEYVAEPGKFYVFIGTNAVDVKQAKFEMK